MNGKKNKNKLLSKKPNSMETKNKAMNNIKKLDLKNIKKNYETINSKNEQKEKNNNKKIKKDIEKQKNKTTLNTKIKENSESKKNNTNKKDNNKSQNNLKSNNITLTKNSKKESINKKSKEEKTPKNKKVEKSPIIKKEEKSPKNNKVEKSLKPKKEEKSERSKKIEKLGIKKAKKNSKTLNIEEVEKTKDILYSKINASKETLSTIEETNPNIENKSILSKDKNNNKIETKLDNNNIKINDIEELNDENNDIEKKKLGKELTPIPQFLVKKKGNQVNSNSKDIQNAIVLRRLEYNDYIKNLNKKKPKPKPKPKPAPKPAPKPKVYDSNKVNEIQKMYKGFQTRNINQIINRLKINLCVTELYCLILREVFNHATKRIAFLILKLYYHEPFSQIDNEIDFSDRIYMKLSNKYYNFNNFNF